MSVTYDGGDGWNLNVEGKSECVVLRVKTPFITKNNQRACYNGNEFHLTAKDAMHLAIELARYAKFVDKSGAEYALTLREAQKELDAEFENPSAKALRGE